MRRYVPFIALGVGAWLAFLISTFPAVTALRWFAPERIRTGNVSGTIWSGSAQLAAVDALPLRDLRWEIDALPLLLARLAGSAQTRLANGFADTQFSVSGNQVRLTDLQLSTSLATLSAMLPISGATGALSAQFSVLELDRVTAQIDGAQIETLWPVSADGSIRISDLLVEPYAGLGNQLIPIGSFELQFTQTGASGTEARIQDLGGPVEFNGVLRLTPALEYRLEGQIATRADASEALVQGLNFMTGEPGPDGRRELLLSGSL